MTFSQLEYVLEINRVGSVSQAAKNLFVSQSSVSVALNSLEKELGFPVFVRSRKGLIPTQRGTNVIHHAASICESHRLMTATPQNSFTNVRISAISIPPVQNAFLRLVQENRERRDIIFSIASEASSLNKLKVFNLELAFSMVLAPHLLSLQKAIHSHGLEYTNVCTMPCAIRLGKDHRLFNAENVTLLDLEDDLFLDSKNAEVSAAMLSSGVLSVRPNRIITATQHQVRHALVDNGLAYEIAPYIPAMHANTTDRHYFPLKDISYKVIAASNPQHPKSPEILRFFKLLQEEVKACGLQE